MIMINHSKVCVQCKTGEAGERDRKVEREVAAGEGGAESVCEAVAENVWGKEQTRDCKIVV